MEYIPVTSRTSAPYRVALLSGKGEALERAEALRGLIAPLVDAGQSRRAIAAALNAAGHRTERGSLWNHKTIGRVTERLGL